MGDCPVEAAPAVGLGVEYRLTGLQTAGAALVAEERVAHLMAFPAATTIMNPRTFMRNIKAADLLLSLIA